MPSVKISKTVFVEPKTYVSAYYANMWENDPVQAAMNMAMALVQEAENGTYHLVDDKGRELEVDLGAWVIRKKNKAGEIVATPIPGGDNAQAAFQKAVAENR